MAKNVCTLDKWLVNSVANQLVELHQLVCRQS